jgi:hypothetical protein
MSFNLAEVLPVLLPRAIAWAEERCAAILSEGVALSEEGLRIARAVGVEFPERIRISPVPELPLPDDPELRQAALQTGLLGPGMVGLTLGYGIYICQGHQSKRLLSHECRHVYQYEIAGSISKYLPQYLDQIVQFGYHDAPFEIDARNHERADGK